MPNPITPGQLAVSGSEDGHQAALFAWCALPEQQLKYPELRWLFAVPNGGYRDKRTGQRLKATGVKRGVADTMLPVRRGVWPGLFLELKVGKNKLQTEQNKFKEFVRSQGYGFVTCWGWEAATKILVEYLEHRGE